MQFLGDKVNLVSSLNTSVSSDTSIEKCVIGANVHIGSECVLQECVILPNTNVPAKTIVKKAVIGLSESGNLDIMEMKS